MPSWFRRAWRQLRGRWVEERGLDPDLPTHLPPDHAPYFTADHGLCCAAHLEQSFSQAIPPTPDHADDPSWSRDKSRYLRERLGGGPGAYPRR